MTFRRDIYVVLISIRDYIGVFAAHCGFVASIVGAGTQRRHDGKVHRLNALRVTRLSEALNTIDRELLCLR